MPLLDQERSDGDAHVRVGISLGPPQHARWSVLFRCVMALPLLVFLLLIGFAAFLATVAAWFCALFTGRVSDGLQQFLTSALRLYANVGAYLWLLTARWPGFGLDARSSDQVTIDIDHVGLNRWSVFFRIVLFYPASIVGSALMFGTYPVLVIVWVIALFTGRAPRTLHQALALIWRFQIRLQAFASLLTPTQPFRGLFGDRDDVISSASPTMVTAPPSFTSQLGAAPIDPVLFPGASTTNAPSANASLPTRWIVSTAAKNAVIFVIVIGALGSYFSNVIAQPLVTRIETSLARSAVNSSHAEVVRAMHQFDIERQSCPTTSSVTCLSNAAATAHDRIAGQLSTTFLTSFVPRKYRSLAHRYEGAINELETALVQIRDGGSPTFDTRVINNELAMAIADVNTSYQRLHRQLGG